MAKDTKFAPNATVKHTAAWKKHQRKIEKTREKDRIAHEKRMAKIQRDHERNMNKIKSKHEKRMQKLERAAEKIASSNNRERYIKRTASVGTKYWNINSKSNKPKYILGTLFSCGLTIANYISMVLVESAGHIDKITSAQGFVSGFLSISPILSLILVLGLAYLVAIIPADIDILKHVHNFATEIVAAGFAMLLLIYVNANPALQTAPESINFDYIITIAPIFIYTLATFLLSFRTIRTAFNTIFGNKNSKPNESLVPKTTSNTFTSENENKSMAFVTFGDVIRTILTILTIAIISLLATGVMIAVLIVSGSFSINLALFMLYGLPTAITVVECFIDPTEHLKAEFNELTASIAKNGGDFAKMIKIPVELAKAIK